MSKIVQAVNAMIGNPSLILKVIPCGDELLFTYKNDHKWSISRRGDGSHRLIYFPSKFPIEALGLLSFDQWLENNEMVVYSDREIGTREAKASFAELYTMLKERVYDVDKVLNEIIETDMAIPY